MTAFTTISNALVAVGAKPFATTIQALRDNPLAIQEGDPTAPVNRAHWHAYNKITMGDANDGLIYDFAVSGAVASITTPDFEDSYEYRLRFSQISHNNGAATNLTISLYREVDAAYGTAGTILSAVVNSASHTVIVELPTVRLAVAGHPMICTMAFADASVGGGTNIGVSAACVRGAQKRLRAQINYTAGSIDNGKVWMDRRRVAF